TERLKEAQLVMQPRGGHFSFRSAATREAVAATVPVALALRIHEAALAHYRKSPLADATRLPSLAWHAARAGAHGEAARTFSTIAERARELHNYLEADLSYTRALAELEESNVDARLRALKGRGIVRYRLGRYDGSLADLELARELATHGGDPIAQADVMLEESTALDWLFEWRRSRELAERARELVATDAPLGLKARVLLALGRSNHRFNQDKEAAELLRDATRIAQSLGDDGYEVEVAGGLLLGFLLPFIGLPEEAQERLDRVAAICKSKGDEMHLGALWNNRSCLWIALNDRSRFMADNGRVLAYAQRMGNANLERNANLNSAYFLYWRAEFGAAEPFARRLIEIDERYFRQGGFRPDGAVLLARILWGAGDAESARKLIDDVRRHQEKARTESKEELLLQPNDEMLLDMISMAVLGGTAPEWTELAQRARVVAQGQELIEVLEVAGVAALRRGERDEARRWWEEALHAGQRIPNVMGPRISGRLQELGN
ncbi:MAG: protein kinase, partial [Polyangiaceae bacterium]